MLPQVHPRYQLLERLGAGGLGTVYRARDLDENRPVALKVLPRRGAAALRSEFLALSRLRHENIVSVYDYGLTEAGDDFFTMEVLDGPPLLSAVLKAEGEVFLRAITSLLRGLAFVHARGLVHADIKPSNILLPTDFLAPNSTSGSKIADFGLATHAGQGGARGTALYAAPEVYRGHIDPRSDLYAVGVVLYQIAHGVLPWQATGLGALLEAQRAGPPELRPRAIDPELERLITALLDPSPGARPQSADEVLATLGAISGEETAGPQSPPAADIGSELIGRESAMAAVNDARERLSGDGEVVLVTGERGVGITRFLGEVALESQLAGAEVRRLRAADVLANALADNLDPEARYALAESAASRLFPEPGGIVLIDDIDRAEERLVDVLIYLARAARASGSLLLLAGTPCPACERIKEAVKPVGVVIAPLTVPQVREVLAVALSAKVADTLAEPMHSATGGNPGNIARSVANLIRTGSLLRSRGQWVVQEGLEIPVARGTIDAALGRVADLSADEREVLEILAILGGRGRVSLVRRLAAIRGPAFDDALGTFVERRLITIDPAAGIAQLRPPELGSAIVASIAEERRKRLARAALDQLQDGEEDPDPELQATLLFGLGEDQAAASVALDAAEVAKARLDHQGAADWLRRALPHLRERAAEAAEKLAALEALLGDIEAAEEHYRASLQDEPSTEARVHRITALADLLRRRGDNAGAHEILMDALEQARKQKLQKAQIEVHLIIGRVLLYRGEYVTAIEHAMTAELLASQIDDRQKQASSCRLRATIESSRGNPQAAISRLEQALSIANQIGDENVTAPIEFEMARAAIHVHDYPRAIEALMRALPSYRRRGRIERVAGALNNLGVAYYFSGDWEKALSNWESFRRVCERVGERAEEVNALNNLGALHRERGELDESLRLLDRAAVLAEETRHGHMAAMVMANRGEVLFKQGDLPGAEDLYGRALKEFERMGAKGDILETERRIAELRIAQGRPTEALDRVIDLAREAGALQATFEEGHLHRVAARALRMTKDLESADWFVKRAAEIFNRIGARYPLALTDVVAAEIARDREDMQEAVALAERATENLEKLGARLDLARARKLMRVLKGSDNERAPVVGPGGHEALVDLMLTAPHLPLDGLLERTLDTVLELTEFERGFILLLDEEGRPQARMRRARGVPWRFARTEAQFSGSIVRRVAGSGEAVAIVDAAADEELQAQRSIVSLGLRRVMCAPMAARGRTIGVLYVDSQRLSSADHAAELPLVEAIASQAAAAVDGERLERETGRVAELMAILAHEIRNPLSGILGYADLGIDEAKEHPHLGELFTRVRHDGQRLRRLIDNIMELARHEAGKTDWSFGPVNMGQLIEDAIASYRVMFGRKDLKVSAEVSDDSVVALGNEDRLMQVLANLLNNAIKFTPNGGSITVTAHTEVVAFSDPEAPPVPATAIDSWSPLDLVEQPARSYVRVDVKDTGPGMSESVQRQLFEKFAQGQTVRKSAGIGLGLYISREIIRQHGGSIWVTSVPGKGATFSFRVPLAAPGE